MILAGDVGGTKTVLGLFRGRSGSLEVEREQTFPSGDYPSLGRIVHEFLGRSRPTLRAAAFGVAGPVVAGRSQVVNLRWPVDARALGRRLGLGRVQVLNDLEATAWGIPELPPRALHELTPGVPGHAGNAALIAAGTGLGMALLVWGGERFQPLASEGGHQSFAPRDELEIGLLRFLSRRYGRVSVERVLCGAAFSAIYDYLISRRRRRGRARRWLGAPDRNAAISEAGLTGRDPTARATLRRFVSFYGAAAGDLALVAKATAGVYIGGGIAPKILPALARGEDFLRSFRAKGRLRPLVESIPVRVILEPRTALIGAAACAAHPMVTLPVLAPRRAPARRRARS